MTDEAQDEMGEKCCCGRVTDSTVNDKIVCRPCMGAFLRRYLGLETRPPPPIEESDLWDDVVWRSCAERERLDAEGPK